MTEHQINSAINSMLPQLLSGKGEAPLLKYAHQHNLAPAMLERLGVVANSRLVLESAKSAAVGERPADIDLIDVQGMLDRYSDVTMPDKKAYTAPTYTNSGFSVGRHFSGAPPEMAKAAAAPAPAGCSDFETRELAERCQILDHEISGVDRLFAEYANKFAMAVSCMVDKARENRQMLPVIVQDIGLLSEKSASVIEDGVRRDVLDRRGWYFDFEGQRLPDVSFTVDRCKIAGFVHMAEDALSCMEACQHVKAELEAEKKAAMSTADMEAAEALQTVKNPDTTPREPAPGKKPEALAEGDPSADAEPAAAAQAVELALAKLRLQHTLNPVRSNLPPGATVNRGEADSKELGAGAALNALEGVGALGNTAAQGLRGTIEAIVNARPGEHAAATAASYKELVAPKAEARAENIRNSMRTLQHRLTLSRLLNTDEVIVKHPPERVMEIFETLMKRAPDLASDVQTARPILREALSYQGVPLSTIKTMNDLTRAKQNPTT